MELKWSGKHLENCIKKYMVLPFGLIMSIEKDPATNRWYWELKSNRYGNILEESFTDYEYESDAMKNALEYIKTQLEVN